MTSERLPVKRTTPVDQRRSPRNREAIPVRLAIASEDYRLEYEAVLIDRSSTGIGIRTNMPLSSGEKVLVHWLDKRRDAIPARVAWANGAEFSFAGAVGLEFLNPLRV